MKNKNFFPTIKQNSFFSQIPEELLTTLFEKINYQILSFQKSEYISFRGEDVRGLYMVLEGCVDTEMLKDNGEIKKIETLNSGKILASAFIFGEFTKFPVDIIARENSSILFIEKKDFIYLLQQDSHLLELYLNEISKKAQFLSKNLWESISNKTINQKLGEYILKNTTDNIFTLKISIKELSEYFNVSRPSLSRVISSFISNGVLEKIETKSYRVLDISLLKKIISNQIKF